MGWLSNLLSVLDASAHDDRPATIRRAGPEEIEPAVRLILAPSGTPVEAQAAREFITFGRGRGIDFEGSLFLAERGGKLITAALPVLSPGRTMLILWPGGLSGRAIEAATRQLIDPMCEIGRKEGVKLVQTLIDPQDQALRRPLEAEGFSRMAELHYLHVTAPVGIDAPAPPEGIDWLTYSAASHELFARTIIASYAQSLDCPALNGLREVEDVLAGHKSAGLFDPEMWFVLREGEAALGVLLLNQTIRGDAVELTYLGLTPAARGRGLGELMVRQALARTRQCGQSRLCLAVDAQNVPALKLYYRHGMQRAGSRLAMLREVR